MAKFREVPCKYYVSAIDLCQKNREASYKHYCQHCDKYEARPHKPIHNKKKQKLNSIKEKEYEDV